MSLQEIDAFRNHHQVKSFYKYITDNDLRMSALKKIHSIISQKANTTRYEDL